MSIRFLSTVAPAPRGFDLVRLTKRVLLSGSVVILVEGLDQLEAVLPDFETRVQGCVLLEGPPSPPQRLGPLLWCLSLPEDHLHTATLTLRPFLELMDRAELVERRARELELQADRLGYDLVSTRTDYNRTTERLREQMHGTAALNLQLTQQIERLQEMEGSLRASEENLRITLDSIGDAVIATDASGAIARMNPVAEALTGWSMHEAWRRPVQQVFQLFDRDTRAPLPDPVTDVLDCGTPLNPSGTVLLITRDGTERNIDHSVAPIRGEDGPVRGVVLVFRDVTERLHLESQLRQSQKMDSIGQLAGGIAHDFNNMLMGIMGSAECLMDTIHEDDSRHQLVQTILMAASRATDLTGKLLSFSRKAHLETQPVDMHEAIAETLALLERSIDRRIVLSRHLLADEATVSGDRSQLQNALLNLGVNARDAMPDGGTLSIATRTREYDDDLCARSPFGLQPGPYLEVRIADDGVGMSPSVRQHIFEPFFTTKQVGRGTGLGLAAVYGTVLEHHGAIEVETEPGKGTAFTLALPLAGPENGSAGPKHASHRLARSDPNRRPCVLLVDDEEVVRRVGASYLDLLGYDALLAEDGARAVAVFKQERAAIDLVLLDMIMPEMNGEQVFAAIRAIDPKAVIVLSSGFADDAQVAHLVDQGLAGFIRKPFRRRALQAVLDKALASRARDVP